MRNKSLATHINAALEGLKDFQACTVDVVCRRLFQEGRRCMLVADEVGLGKTIVARGVIARALQQRLNEGRRSPYRVTYICSNQVIAQENLNKLNLFPRHIHMKSPVSRIAFLARDEEEEVPEGKIRQNLLELNTLTPATSFEISNSIGTKDERAILYALLCRDRKMCNRWRGLGWLLKGGVRNMRDYRTDLEREFEKKFRMDLAPRLIRLLKRERLPSNMSKVYAHLKGTRRRTLYEAVLEFADIIGSRADEKRLHKGCLELTRLMRKTLIRCCLRYVNADLYILDEFQRFRDLINADSEDEQAVIAREIFFKGNTRVLLLSATPFKAFTGYDDLERGEDHYKDFGRVLKFLLHDDDHSLPHYEKHRQALYRQMLDLRTGALDLTDTHRREVETVLRSVICRTERHSVADDPNALILDTWKTSEIPFGQGDIENFRLTDIIAGALSKVGYPAGKPIEYCKSAIFPFSYLDRYKMKEVLKKHRNAPEIQRDLDRSADGWLDLEKVNDYSWSLSENDGVGNARLRMLLDQTIGSKGEQLLWVPPSLPYYDLGGAFSDCDKFSKTLLFSAWIMVPRMVATLVSYEVERRTIGNKDTVEEQEKESRTYFTPDQKRRRPVPQLRYTRRDQSGEGLGQPANMTNFALLYPSQSLANIIQPAENIRDRLSLSELKQHVSQKLQELIDRSGLQQFVSRSSESERWYWAGPLLLDKQDKVFEEVASPWFGDDQTRKGRRSFFGQERDFSQVKEDHAKLLRNTFDNPLEVGLGPIPDDLADVLAELAIGSPAVTALRSLTRMFPDVDTARHMVSAFDVGDNFVTLFNKPESIAAVRLCTPRNVYWRMVADYCASGCIQAVFDEYFHLLKGQSVDADGAITQLLAAVNLNASVINVDSLKTFKAGTAKKMRCHYAVEFGSQKIETEDGRDRATSLREVFNSPFRPFVLATTSIGQEGLDFHSYCRRIVHWNLPGNPVDLEQREGRINRYKGLVIRQHLARKYGHRLASAEGGLNDDVWERLFAIADQLDRVAEGKCELVPYWHMETDDVKIERVVPMYPFSRDQSRLQHILKTLAVYRLAFGQPRQTELVDHLLERDFTEEELKAISSTLMIDLSPINYING